MNFAQYLEALKSAPIPKEMAFPEAEYASRVAKIRTFMAEEELDALLITDVPNVCYVSGYETFVPNNFACMVLTIDGEPALQVAEFEIPGALLNSWVKDVRPTRFNDIDAVSRQLTAILAEKKLDGKRIGIETRLGGYNIETYESMKRALPNASFVDASNIVFRARLVKSPAEIVHMREAAAIATASLAETLKTIKNGSSENEVAAVAYAELARRGSEYFSCQPCVSVGHRAGWIHTSQRGARIGPGQTLIMELGAFVRRYVGGVMHTAVVGDPSKDVLRLAKASDDTLNLVQSCVKPGRSVHDVALEVKRGLDGLKDEVYTTGMFGYAVGLSFPPTWREGKFMIAEGVHETFVPGMTFLTPVTVRLPGKLGVGYTETFLVTENGCEVLTARDRSLKIIS